MLVFGLGYDSKMWYNGNKNTYFIESNDEYISLNIIIILCNYYTFEHLKRRYNLFICH